MKRKYTDEELHKEALKYKTRGEFQKENPSKYALSLQRGILNKVCSHMDYLVKPKWSEEDLLTEALKYKTRGELRKALPGVYSGIHKRKLQSTHFAHMNNVRKSWDSNSILKEAKKYKTRSEFEKNCPSAYSASRRLDMGVDIDDILYRKWNIYTDEEVCEEAKKYKTRGEFYKFSSSFHLLASRRGILDKVCTHMKKPTNTSLGELEVFDFIKENGFNGKKLKKRCITIEGKPHIKGFDIDIYIPNLNKGIEYDGVYWHSVEQMSKKKPHWSLDDIKNYHKIKDDFFLSEGIEILHITDKYWTEDREEAKKDILFFLNNDSVV